MISKQQFLDDVANEVRICKHLFTKLPPGSLDFRLGETMRTTLELLRYLSHCASTHVYNAIHNDWANVHLRNEAAAQMTAEEFPQRMDAQLEEIRRELAGISEEEIRTRIIQLPWGGETTFGSVLVQIAAKFLAAYRLQLFLHAKAAGASELNTYNCWMGVDPPVKA